MLISFLLSCAPLPEDTDPGEGTDTEDEPVWVQLNVQPCALSEAGEVRCWRSEIWDAAGVLEYGAPPQTEPLTVFNRTRAPFWGISQSTGLPVMLAQPSKTDRPNNVTGYTEIGQNCALLNGALDCWAFTGEEEFYGDERYTLFAEGAVSALLNEANELRSLSIFPGTTGWERLPLNGPVQKLMVINPAIGCALFETGEIECFGEGAPLFDNPPYVDVAGGFLFGCGVKADGVVECNNGESYDFGEPIRDLTVWSWESRELIDAGTPDERWIIHPPSMDDLPHICVITESNAIRCQGWRYDFLDLQAALPKGE